MSRNGSSERLEQFIVNRCNKVDLGCSLAGEHRTESLI